MKYCFGYTTPFPIAEYRVKYFDEDGIHDEMIPYDIGSEFGIKLKEKGYVYAKDLGKAETKMFETKPDNPKYKEVLSQLNRIRDKYNIAHWDEKERVA